MLLQRFGAVTAGVPTIDTFQNEEWKDTISGDHDVEEMKKKEVLVFSTGGTFSSFTDGNGANLRPRVGKLKSILQTAFSGSRHECPTLFGAESPFYFMEMKEPIDSTEAEPYHWNLISRIIFELVGVLGSPFGAAVVIHGTDTLADSAAAVSFQLRRLRATVIFTGSQIPLPKVNTLDEVDFSSDAISNFVFACNMALKSIQARSFWEKDKQYDISAQPPPIPGVWVAFSGKLMHGCRVIKKCSKNIDAFHSPGRPPMARIFDHLQKNLLCNKPYSRYDEHCWNLCCHFTGTIYVIAYTYKRALHHAKEDCDKLGFCVPSILPIFTHSNVLLLSLVPGMFRNVKVEAIYEYWKTYEAIIVSAYGSGNIPVHIQKLLKYYETELDGIVIIISKCETGGVSDNYAANAKFSVKINKITPHAAYAKTLLLLSLFPEGHGISNRKETLQTLLQVSLNGECSRGFKGELPLSNK